VRGYARADGSLSFTSSAIGKPQISCACAMLHWGGP
jgi:hypothetical protein